MAQTAPPPVLPASGVKSLPIRLIDPSPLNPRQHIDQKTIEELADSISSSGLLNPILVRPHPTKRGRYELIHGERRTRAHKVLGKKEILGRVVKLDDAAVLLAQTVENLQREDISPLDEGRGYRRLQDKFGMTPKEIAKHIGKGRKSKSETYVLRRMKLTDLIESAQTQLERGKLSVAHAILISRLQPKEQQRALGMIRNEYNGEIPVETLDKWIQREVYKNLEAAPFDSTSVGEHDDSYETKVAAYIKKQKAEGKAAGITLLEVVTGYPRDTTPQGLAPAEWREVKTKTCEFAVPAIVVQGADRGRVLQVCPNRRCRTHWGTVDARARAEAERERRAAKKARARRRKAEAVRFALLQAVAKKAPPRLDVGDLSNLALAFVDNLNPEARKRVAQMHDWMPGGNGDAAATHERIRRRVKGMEQPDLARFLRELSLLDELDVPSDQIGRAPVRLRATAERYGIDIEKVERQTLEELRVKFTSVAKAAVE